MSTIRNTKKTLVERLSLKQESMKDKSLLERIGMDPTPSTKLYNKLVEADPCWYKVDDFYFVSCPPELHFRKNKKLLRIKEYKELLVSQTSFGHISINSPSILTVSMATESP